MKKIFGASRRGIALKYVVVAWIILLEIFAAVYLYANPVSGASQNPFFIATSTSTTTTTKTTTTHQKPDQIKVESALIVNDTLMMKVDNEGPSSTTELRFMDLCTPGFGQCYDYKKMAGGYYSHTFVLPAGNTFILSMPGVCVIAIPGCKTYLPVANATYALEVNFQFADGQSVLVPVTAKASNTWSSRLTSIMGATPLLTVYPKTLTGILNVTVDVNSTVPRASWETLLDGYMKPNSAFSGTIISNKTGCSACSTLRVIMNFTTVLTGITSGTYYSVVIRDTTDLPNNSTEHGFPDNTIHPSSFALWVECTSSPPTKPSK